MRSQTSDKTISGGLIEMDREEAMILMESGYFLMQLGKKKEAREVFIGVQALFPNSEVPCVALGHWYLSEGKPAQAIKEHEKALKLAPKSSVAQAHLGEALLFHKKIDEGTEALNKAIKMDPHGVAAKFAKELLRAKDLHVFDS